MLACLLHGYNAFRESSYTSKGRVDGIDGNVDLNVLTGTKPMEYFIGEKAAENKENMEETKMTYDPKKVLAIAEAEVGYLEKKSNADLDDKTANAGDKNYTKYARDLDALNFYNGRKNGYAWCDVFVDWCFVQAYGKEAALELTCQPTNRASNYGAGCKWSRKYYEKNGLLHDNAVFLHRKRGEHVAEQEKNTQNGQTQ